VKANVGQIWEAASTEPTRPILTGVMFDAGAGTLTATNSYIAARVPCEVEEGDESGIIPAEAIKTAKGESLRVAKGKATLQLGNGERSWTLIEGVFPDVDKILATTPEAATRFGVNPDLLRSLALALGCGGKSYTPLVLHPVSPLKGMLVAAPSEGVGVLMPVRIDGEKRDPLPTAPNIGDDEVLIAAVKAARAALDGRRGKKRAAQAFRAALEEASQAA
jgi:hypothetical protein